jgi:acyl carrier protein
MFRLDIQVPDSIADDTPFTGGTLDLDSLDMLELAICVEEEFGIAIRSGEEARIAFGSVASLAGFIHVRTQARQTRQPSWAGFLASGAEGGLPAGPFARRSIAQAFRQWIETA